MTLREQKCWRVKLNQDKDWEIRGKYGVINEYPDGDLDVWVTRIRISAAMERDGWVASQHYDDGALFIRPFSDLDLACKWIKAGKRRRMSPEQSAAASERLKNHRKQKAIATTMPFLQEKLKLEGGLSQ